MRIEIRDVQHTRICGSKDTVCHWPRQGGLWYWGDDEILVGHIHAPCQYKNRDEVAHGQHGMFSRAVVRLNRSLDLGQTWPEELTQVVYDYTLPAAEQRRRLHVDDYTLDTGPARSAIDMTGPDSIMIFGRAFVGKERTNSQGVAYNDQIIWGYRSADRGRTWEDTPSIVWPNHTEWITELANNTMRMPDGTLMGWFVASGPDEGLHGQGTILHPQMYMSVDQGQTWHYVSDIYRDPFRAIACSYPHILALPSGRLMCTMGLWMTPYSGLRWISINYSDDGGLTWSEPRRICRWGVSPYPLRLQDDRLVILYARRYANVYGMACITSEDEGATWSEEYLLRDDAGHNRLYADIGYPVATQLRDGRVFTAYYYQLDDPDVPWAGGRKFIAGTFFHLK